MCDTSNTSLNRVEGAIYSASRTSLHFDLFFPSDWWPYCCIRSTLVHLRSNPAEQLLMHINLWNGGPSFTLRAGPEGVVRDETDNCNIN